MLLWGNGMPEEKAGQFLQSKDFKTHKNAEKVVWLCPLYKWRNWSTKFMVILSMSWICPGSLLVCLPPLDMLFPCSFIFTVRTHHIAIQPEEHQFYTKPKKMKIRVEKENKQEKAPAELEDTFCTSWSGLDGRSIKVQLSPEFSDMEGKRNLRPNNNPGTKGGDVVYGGS